MNWLIPASIHPSNFVCVLFGVAVAVDDEEEEEGACAEAITHKNCLVCGVEFIDTSTSNRRKYCGTECAKMAIASQRRAKNAKKAEL